MAIKVYKPTTPARRHMSVLVNDVDKKAKPIKKLRIIRKRSGGRNNQGKITVRHIGGGAKQFLRLVDFKRDRFDIPAKVEAIEYDPNRNANIARVLYADGVRNYILAANKMTIGQQVVTSKEKYITGIGNRFPLEIIPTGQTVYNIELQVGRGGVIVRGAGAAAVLMVIEGRYAQLKLPSGEIRKVFKECLASVGQVSNPDFRNIRWGKAGRMRYRGIKPTVRGKAMNPVDHPHGGGEARNPIGLKYPKTPWGKHTLGVKTRKAKKASSKMIVKRRAKRK
ncbi:MAG: 50S ribosomal protein L2 [Parcubacteria group bacterium CG1_02_37_51]|uniref:Large ribosomal subunit protein uL2 n=2 Tax=Candidatus Komeiliibacteriota TaxID=1817908 RepID=A0A2M8DQA0_9BACT|nr:MAG: 50S ribosomal protein L2 [Parcubacteria group bacterium CG1_02_37_51]PIY94828.1 MAG: 50S ribosomal protein L2 [Candidatus Komeilibacteria bacterium CG_4_10_14_0_8_um_filter_37_78]PJC01143.1 MAG: 50S ribosomal protein L2 [Candidatus Komeilibacteria bacterium CG_4_9_14_0_8_um_filter_36_9]